MRGLAALVPVMAIAAGAARAQSVRTTPAVVLDAAAREYRVVRVAVPADLPPGDSVRFDVEAREGSSVLGPTHGVLPPGDPDRGVTLTLSPSSSLPAGENVAAILLFRSAAGVAVRVPLVIRVPPRRVLTLAAERPVTPVQPGARGELRYRIQNGGNVPLALRLAVRAPAHWSARDHLGAELDLAPGETRLRSLTVDVPVNADDGSFTIAVAATQDTAVLGTVELYVNVLSRNGAAAARAPRLTTSVGSAFSGSGGDGGGMAPGRETAVAMILGGELPGQRSIQGQLELVLQAKDPTALRTLSALGFVPNMNFLAVTDPHWSLRGGAVGLADDPLAGTSVWGNGGALGWRGGQWQAEASVTEPVTGTGSYFAARSSRRLGALSLGAVVSRLDDSLAVRRSLTAATLGLRAEQPTLEWNVEVGGRSWDGGSGFGAMAEVRQHSDIGSLWARVVAAPGGSEAFARAERELQLSASRRIGRAFELTGAAWESRDRNAAFSEIRGSGWTLQPRWRVRPWLTLGSSVRRNALDATGAAISFGTRETEFAATADVVLGPFALSATTATGPMSQITAIPGGPTIERSITRVIRHATASWSGPWGELEAELSAQRNGAGLGLPRESQDYTVRASRIPLPVGRLAVTGRAEWSQLKTGPGLAPLERVLVGFDASLPSGLLLTATAERNEAFYGAGVPVPWVVGLRVTHALSMSALVPRGGGVVFEDRNANGRRDEGERGVPGILVLVDGRPEASDAHGRFDAPENAHVEVDAASLPYGWVVSGPDGRDWGVVPTGSLAVTLKLGTDSLGRTATVNFQRLVVAAYDTAGRRWACQPSATGRALFDALPAGEYRVEIEVPGGEASPAAQEAEHRVHVRPGGEPASLTFTILPRRTRVQRLGPGGSHS